MFRFFLSFLVLLIFSTNSVLAVSDPRSVPNNKVGINTLSPEAELDEAKTLVNTNGDWGYVVITIAKNERDQKRWQNILNQATKNHLIPIIRLATEFDTQNGYWNKPDENDADEWANFFSKLYFPTKNRYIQVYNEVNRSSEWGGIVDPSSYAMELNKTIDAFKLKSDDFFMLNAPLDLALWNSKTSIEASQFFRGMENSVPGIFKKLDGWASHSYPNPNFSASPYELGRIGINGYDWELSEIAQFTQEKKLPVFITETGWKREEGIKQGLSEETISDYYKEAFTKIWDDERVVLVAPFLLGYPESLFNQFAFKTSGETNKNYYKYFFAIRDLPKTLGLPQKDDSLSDIEVFIPNYFIKGIGRYVTVMFRNTGNYIWKPERDLRISIPEEEAQGYQVFWSKDDVYPGGAGQAVIIIRNEAVGIKPTTIQILNNSEVLSEKQIYIRTETTLSLLIQKLRTLLSIA